MTQTLLEESKLLSKSYTSSSLDKDENVNNTENHSLITSDIDLSMCNGNKSILKEPDSNSNEKNTESFNHVDGNLEVGNPSNEFKLENGVVANGVCCGVEIPVYSRNGGEDNNSDNLNSAAYKHLYPKVVVQNPSDLSDVDSDEEDFRLRMHSKSDSGQGSSVETSSLKSSTQDFYQVDIHFDDQLGATMPNNTATDDKEILDQVLDDNDLPLKESFARRHSSITSRVQEIDKKLEETNFTDIPLNTPNTPSPRRPTLNTYTPTSSLINEDINNVPSQQAILKPPIVTDTPVNDR